VYDWIQKFVPKISEYVDSLAPNLSETWHADEVFVKCRTVSITARTRAFHFPGMLWTRKTRFMLASKLSPLRDRAGALQAFREAQKNAHGNYPEQIFCD